MAKKFSLDELIAHETKLQFDAFNNQTAWALGCQIKQHAEATKANIAFEIYAFGHTLFSYAMPGASADNQDWLYRKRQTVLRFAHSSLLVGDFHSEIGHTFEQMQHLDAKQYAFQGGGFPIIVKGNGLVGAVTVSGLTEEDDHRMVVDAIDALMAQ